MFSCIYLTNFQALEDGTLDDIEDDIKLSSGKKKKRKRDEDDDEVGPNGKPTKVNNSVFFSHFKLILNSIGRD